MITRTKAHRRACYTLIEVVISIVIVGTMLVAALHAVGASRLGLQRVGDHSRGTLLAQQLMAEALQREYSEPDDLPVFGCEPGEGGPSRLAFDDVDDYHQWSASPPQRKDGTPIPGHEGWQRSVEVALVASADLGLGTPGPETGSIKRIAVSVSHNGAIIAELTALRTDAWSPLARGAEPDTPVAEPELQPKLVPEKWQGEPKLVPDTLRDKSKGDQRDHSRRSGREKGSP